MQTKVDTWTQMPSKLFADFSCQVAGYRKSKMPLNIVVRGKGRDKSGSEESFHTDTHSKTGGESISPNNMLENDEEGSSANNWLPEIEKLITNINPDKKTSTLFNQHEKDQLITPESPSPEISLSTFPVSFNYEESTENSTKLAAQLSSMVESYKQVCKERNYLKKMMQSHLRGKQDRRDSRLSKVEDSHSLPKIILLPAESLG